jgi:hypothetical protein
MKPAKETHVESCMTCIGDQAFLKTTRSVQSQHKAAHHQLQHQTDPEVTTLHPDEQSIEVPLDYRTTHSVCHATRTGTFKLLLVENNRMSTANAIGDQLCDNSEDASLLKSHEDKG